MASKIVVDGFETIKVKFDEKQDAYHVLYLKSHSVREENKRTPSGRTLFVLNVPPYCTKASLRALFGCCGAVQSVYIQKQPGQVCQELSTKSLFSSQMQKITGFKVAYVVFKKESSLKNALQLDSSEIRILSTEEKPIETGVNKWCKEYASKYPIPEKLQKEIDEFMLEFDQKQEEEKEKAKRMQSEPDEEGWVTVGKGGRKPGATKVDIVELQERKKKKKQKALLHFYNFQQRETRREYIAQLRKKFEEDKEKIAKMKAARKFRPY